MSEFKKIETEEEFNAAIKDRIARAEKTTREAVSKEYDDKLADYDKVKKQNEEYASQITKLTDSSKDFEAKLTENSKTIDELNLKIKTYESDSVKTRIGLEKGLPYEMIKRLNGATEEEIEKDAELMSKYVGKKGYNPTSSTEPDSYDADKKTKALKELASKMTA